MTGLSVSSYCSAAAASCRAVVLLAACWLTETGCWAVQCCSVAVSCRSLCVLRLLRVLSTRTAGRPLCGRYFVQCSTPTTSIDLLTLCTTPAALHCGTATLHLTGCLLRCVTSCANRRSSMKQPQPTHGPGCIVLRLTPSRSAQRGPAVHSIYAYSRQMLATLQEILRCRVIHYKVV